MTISAYERIKNTLKPQPDQKFQRPFLKKNMEANMIGTGNLSDWMDHLDTTMFQVQNQTDRAK